MKNLAPRLLFLLPLAAVSAFASDWDDLQDKAPQIAAEGVGRPQPLPPGDRYTPEMLEWGYRNASRLTNEGEAFSILAGSTWECTTVKDLPSPGEHRRMSFDTKRYTFSPRDRGVRRHGADGQPSAGANHFAFVPGDGWAGSALDSAGRAYSDESIRYSPESRGRWRLITREVAPSSGETVYGICRAVAAP